MNNLIIDTRQQWLSQQETQNAFEVSAKQPPELLCVQKLIVLYDVDVKPSIANMLRFITQHNHWNKTKIIYEATDRKSICILQSEFMNSLIANFWVHLCSLGQRDDKEAVSMQNTCYDPIWC